MNNFKSKLKQTFSETFQLINELRITGIKESANKFIQWKDILIVFDENEEFTEEQKKALHIISNKSDIDFGDIDDPYNVFQIARDYMDDSEHSILVGEIDDDLLTIESGADMMQGENSVNIHKVARALGSTELELVDSVGESKFIPIKRHVDFPNTAYHGTDLLGFLGILKNGLRPQGRRKSNYANHNIFHEKEVFLTDKPSVAGNHAIHAAKQNESSPVIIEFKIPDKRYIQPDYDIDTYTGATHYHDVRAQSKPPFKIGKKGRPLGKSRDVGIFGYTGHIPRSHIVDVFSVDPDENLSNDINNNDYHRIDVDVKETINNIKKLNDIGYDIETMKEIGLLDIDFLNDTIQIDDFIDQYENEEEYLSEQIKKTFKYNF